VQNNVDLFWKKFPGAHPESYFLPNVDNGLFIGGVGSTQALFAPQHEFWYAKDLTFVDYDQGATGAISVSDDHSCKQLSCTS
jgi:hypothetical protein